MAKPSSVRWNIFARELEDILAARGLRLGHLNDRGVVYHPQKVRRLQLSLTTPGHLTTLNPEEIERLTTIMQLNAREQQRLHAALLATAVEMVLMDRIDPETALMASDDVFNILFAAMQAKPGGAMAVGVKGSGMDDTDNTDGTADPEMPGDAAFSQALNLLDRATLSLHIGQQTQLPQAQLIHAHQAYEGYTGSIVLLQRCQVPNHESESWHFWYTEATHGQEQAEELMHSGKGDVE